MILKKKLKTFLLALVLCLTAGNLFAIEEYVSKVYKEIDIIFVKQADRLPQPRAGLLRLHTA